VRRTRLHLAVAGALLVVVSLLVPLPVGAQWPAHLLIGWVVGAVAFCVPLLRLVHRLDAPDTAALVAGADGGRTETDVIVVVAAVASLAAAVLMLAGGGSGPTSSRVFEGALTVLAVGSGWVAVHTVYTLRYARHYLVEEPGCIDFNGDDAPRLSDFAYFSFTLGMTYQVSDTALRTPQVRQIVLHHTLLSYVFGTVIVAATINLVVGLAGASGG
jgi:uncharacterized membrane protein